MKEVRTSFMTVRLWNNSIREAVSQGRPNKALLLLLQMKLNGFEPDNFSFLFAAKACSKISCSLRSKALHARIVKSQFRSDVFLLTAILDMYVKSSNLDHAHKVFGRIPVRDTTAWNSIILGFAQSGMVDRVLCLFSRMRREGISPDSVTIMGLTQSASNSKKIELLNATRSISVRSGFERDVSVANTLMSAYAKCNDIDSSESVFNMIDSEVRTIVSWNSMIEAYSKLGRFPKSLDCYKKMLHKSFRPDSYTIVSVISSCLRPEAAPQGASVHSHAIQLGCDSDIYLANTLISVYSKWGDLVSARSLFDSMRYRTVVSWNVMISGYAEKQDLDKALGLFHVMESTGERPDSLTLLSLLSACSQTGLLEIGKQIDDYAVSNGLRDDIVICNSLIDMYAKCGNVSEARDLFYAMPERSFVSWTTMISGLAINGKAKEALDLFNAMIGSGLEQNHVTFLAALQACVHAGFLEKGIEIFEAMTRVYDISPGLDHYSCLVDLLGRKGRIEKALELIRSMPMKPDTGIWSSILHSCKTHRNIEIAEHASRRLIEIEPSLSVSYVEMASIYASDGKWDRAAAMRKLMKRNSVKKIPGQSVVIVEGKSHAFTVEDLGHPEGVSICELLRSLTPQLGLACLTQRLFWIMS